MLNKILLFSVIGVLTVMLIDILLTFENSMLVYTVSTILFFLEGLFVSNKKIEQKFLATVLIFFPLSGLTLLSFFINYYCHYMHLLLGVSVVLFMLGFIVQYIFDKLMQNERNEQFESE